MRPNMTGPSRMNMAPAPGNKTASTAVLTELAVMLDKR